MSTIQISTQILAGNLGDGWADQNGAADALADYTRSIWADDVAEFIAAGHDVEIDIDVQHNTEGSSRDFSVDISGPMTDGDFDLMERVERSLTDEATIWERFCESDEANEYAA